MKWWKRISIWILVSLTVQCLGLFYIDHYFLATDSKVVTKKVVEDKSVQEKSIDINVPTDAQKTLVSYDAKYLSYFQDEQLKIVDCKDGKVQTIKAEDGAKICFSEWLPDRNRMLLVEKNTSDNSSKLILYSYDVSKDEKIKSKDLSWGGTNALVEDIQLSTLTGVQYVKVSSDNEGSTIYRIDRNTDMSKINTIPKFVSNIALVRHEDILVYEGSVYNKIYATNRQEAISINGVDKLKLIGTDSDDNVYIGQLKDDLISKVYYGKTSQDINQWKSVNLKVPCSKENLFISSDNKVYQNDELRGVLKDINSGSQTTYKGKLLQLYTKGVVSLVDNKISFVPFK